MNWYKKYITSQRGEWWIEGGRAEFADANIGDYNHSGVVIEAILAQNDLLEDTLSMDLSKETEESLREKGLSDEEIKVVLDQSDPREFAMKNWGWQRVAGDNVQTERLSEEDMKNIANGLWDAFENEIESNPDMTFNIEVNSTRKIYRDVPYNVLNKGTLTDLLPYGDQY